MLGVQLTRVRSTWTHSITFRGSNHTCGSLRCAACVPLWLAVRNSRPIEVDDSSAHGLKKKRALQSSPLRKTTSVVSIVIASRGDAANACGSAPIGRRTETTASLDAT
jgi:hypothetical protein